VEVKRDDATPTSFGDELRHRDEPRIAQAETRRPPSHQPPGRRPRPSATRIAPGPRVQPPQQPFGASDAQPKRRPPLAACHAYVIHVDELRRGTSGLTRRQPA
jgi:hypothetical protein